MYIVLPVLSISIIVTIMLCAEALLDMQTEELDLSLIAITFCFGIIIMAITPGTDWVNSMVGFLFGLVPFAITALIGNGGGGDIILMAATGALIGGYNVVYVILFAFLFYIMQGVITWLANLKNPDFHFLKAQFPFAPHVLMGWIATVFCSTFA